MNRFVLPDDIAQIVLDTAWGADAPPVMEFRRELVYLQTFHECVPEGLIQPCFFDVKSGYLVNSPFRRNTAYVPLQRLRFANIWEGYLVRTFAEAFTSETLRSVNTYRGILNRRVKNLLGSPCSHTGWNEFVETFSRLKRTDLKPYSKLLYDSVLGGLEIGKYSTFPKDIIIPKAESQFMKAMRRRV